MSDAPSITIVGLGPGDPALRTLAVQDAIDDADRILARTLDHPGLADLASDDRVTDISRLAGPLPGNTRDWAVGARLACDLALEGARVVVAVPGHPRYGERLVIETIAEATRRNIPCAVLDGLSVLDLACTALGIDAMVDEVQIVDGAASVQRVGDDAFGGGLFPFTPLRPLLVSRVYTAQVMAGMQRLLLRLFPADHQLTLLDGVGVEGEQHLRVVPLSELGDQPGGPRLSLWVPAMDALAAGRDPRTMQQISARLRAPDGCPWDRVQTHGSLTSSFLDEVYEVIDAIEAGDSANLAEELGDLFLHIVLQAQVAEEAGEFTIEDVYEGVAAKIVRRHPHVFGDEVAETEADLARIWRRVKAEEKQASTGDSPAKDPDGSPLSMPALPRAARVLAKHPLAAHHPRRSSEDRSRDLLEVVSAIVEAGDDPEVVLREALRNHTTQALNRVP